MEDGGRLFWLAGFSTPLAAFPSSGFFTCAVCLSNQTEGRSIELSSSLRSSGFPCLGFPSVMSTEEAHHLFFQEWNEAGPS
jgi:hypothetical protein